MIILPAEVYGGCIGAIQGGSHSQLVTTRMILLPSPGGPQIAGGGCCKRERRNLNDNNLITMLSHIFMNLFRKEFFCVLAVVKAGMK